MNKFKSLFKQLFMILCRPKVHLRYVIVLPLTNKGPFTLGVIPAVYRAVLRTCPISALLFISA